MLGGVDGGYARRRRDVFIVAVSCTEPADTCFCASVGCGPGVESGYDLALRFEGFGKAMPASEISPNLLTTAAAQGCRIGLL